ncbi:DNA repair helicase rad25 [Dermatophilus congolensis]|uniref:DNA repair helicase rad25 n=1 Tax=Dermatophilus congolensis TaxID=1863 RepID=A0AA46BLJ6_9MICO|nr:DNA repair helicase rad25 [Dermatophilus congolensis]
MTNGALIVQSDKTLLLEVNHPDAVAARAAIAPFAELERSPEHIHTYRITPLGLWNARSAGYDAETVVHALVEHSRYPVPHSLLVDIADTMDRYGRLRLIKDSERLVLEATDLAVFTEVTRHKKSPPSSASASTTNTSSSTTANEGTSNKNFSKSGGPPKTEPDTSMENPTPSTYLILTGNYAPTNNTPSTASWPVDQE